jgi:hypothetical protein
MDRALSSFIQVDNVCPVRPVRNVPRYFLKLGLSQGTEMGRQERASQRAGDAWAKWGCQTEVRHLGAVRSLGAGLEGSWAGKSGDTEQS